jgi:O-methyltransferase
MTSIVEKVLSDYTIIPNNMVKIEHIRAVLENIDKVLVDNVAGDIVEFGCYEGTTSLFIARFLKICRSTKRFHVYDSFQGLPKKRIEDGNCDNFVKGSCSTSRLQFEMNFLEAGLMLPEIHECWFQDIEEDDVPKSIAFAFLDGDFYSSIMDSLIKVYSRMTVNARIVIHDYDSFELPGVTKACTDFLQGKPEKVIGAGCGLLVKN